jgi:hypothetical protein
MRRIFSCVLQEQRASILRGNSGDLYFKLQILNRLQLFGGAGRDRTGDLLVANEALSQLSYSPTISLFYQNPIRTEAEPGRAIRSRSRAIYGRADRCRGRSHRPPPPDGRQAPRSSSPRARATSSCHRRPPEYSCALPSPVPASPVRER